MFHCFHARKLRSFLLLDIAAVLLWLFCSAVGRAFSAEARPEGIFLPVIMYHSITEHPSGDYQITPDAFAEDLRYLRANGYESVSVAQLLPYTEGTGTLPAHPVLLTFDDGFYNNLSAALPLLEQYDMCAVVSVVGYYTDVTAARDPHVPAYSYLEWEDIRALLRSGRIEIGSHTYDLHSNEERAERRKKPTRKCSVRMWGCCNPGCRRKQGTRPWCLRIPTALSAGRASRCCGSWDLSAR